MFLSRRIKDNLAFDQRSNCMTEEFKDETVGRSLNKQQQTGNFIMGGSIFCK